MTIADDADRWFLIRYPDKGMFGFRKDLNAVQTFFIMRFFRHLPLFTDVMRRMANRINARDRTALAIVRTFDRNRQRIIAQLSLCHIIYDQTARLSDDVAFGILPLISICLIGCFLEVRRQRDLGILAWHV